MECSNASCRYGRRAVRHALPEEAKRNGTAILGRVSSTLVDRIFDGIECSRIDGAFQGGSFYC